MLFKSETGRSRVAHVSMRDMKVGRFRAAGGIPAPLPPQCHSSMPPCAWPCSPAHRATLCHAPATLHCTLSLQPEKYVSKLVIVPGIVTSASRPKHKATYLTVQCKECK